MLKWFVKSHVAFLNKIVGHSTRNSAKFLRLQWSIQSLPDAGILVGTPKLSAQIKGELMRNNISHL